MSHVEKLARDIRTFLLTFCFMYLITLAFGPFWFLQARDDTDAHNERSGMRLLIDHGTGCQYLQRGGITPRLDANVNHICGDIDDRF